MIGRPTARVAELVTAWPIAKGESSRHAAAEFAADLQETDPDLWHDYCIEAGRARLLEIVTTEARYRRGRAQSARIQQHRADVGEALIDLGQHPGNPDAIAKLEDVIRGQSMSPKFAAMLEEQRAAIGDKTQTDG